MLFPRSLLEHPMYILHIYILYLYYIIDPDIIGIVPLIGKGRGNLAAF